MTSFYHSAAQYISWTRPYGQQPQRLINRLENTVFTHGDESRSKAFMHICLCVCAHLQYRTKMAETTITKLATWIVHTTYFRRSSGRREFALYEWPVSAPIHCSIAWNNFDGVTHLYLFDGTTNVTTMMITYLHIKGHRTWKAYMES